MKKVKIITVLIVLFIVGLLGFLLARHFTPTTQDTTAIVKEMRALDRWETSSFTVDKVIDSGKNGNVFQQFLFGNRILLVAEGEVIAGFDLSTLSNKEVKMNGSSIEITLPAPEILTTSINNSKTKVYDRQQGLLVPSSNNLESEALATAEKSIQQAACSEGILTTAATNAKSQLTSILSSFRFTTITINIPSGHC